MKLAIGILIVIGVYILNRFFGHLEKKRKERFKHLSLLKIGDEITIRRFGEFQGETVTCTVVRNIQCLNSIELRHTYGISCELQLHYNAKEFKKIIEDNEFI